MKKRDIKNREDVFLLINRFYQQIRKDDVLGPIFNNAIGGYWEEHLEHLTDFWETNLFGVVSFKGNPVQKHQEVAIKNKHSITAEHFGIWLQYWFNTIDNMFTGDKADTAKRRAQKMSTFLLIKMFEAGKSK